MNAKLIEFMKNYFHYQKADEISTLLRFLVFLGSIFCNKKYLRFWRKSITTTIQRQVGSKPALKTMVFREGDVYLSILQWKLIKFLMQ